MCWFEGIVRCVIMVNLTIILLLSYISVVHLEKASLLHFKKVNETPCDRPQARFVHFSELEDVVTEESKVKIKRYMKYVQNVSIILQLIFKIFMSFLVS